MEGGKFGIAVCGSDQIKDQNHAENAGCPESLLKTRAACDSHGGL